jgi:REP element-mobilizing transposase RayT
MQRRILPFRPTAWLIPARGNAPGPRPFFELQANGLLHKVASGWLTLYPFFTKSVMPQSLSQVILHIVFSTKERRPWLDAEIRPRMHGYLATVCRDCDCEAYRVGGTADHVHIAARLARTISQAELLEKIKKTSSAWIKEQGNQYAGFFWQGGYGDFSIGWSQLEDLKRYIDHQEQHHRTQTFQEEYRGLLAKYHLEFDERYVWD